MKTSINDRFPMDLLECEYLEVCSSYDSKKCFYGQRCPFGVPFGEKMVTVRGLHKLITEQYMADECLRSQIEHIVDEGNKNEQDNPDDPTGPNQ
jgi:hypothetical protein